MRIVTDLMDKIFSEETPDDFKKSVSEKIEEAKANGQAEFSNDEYCLSFADADECVIIEDKFNNNEVTLAFSDVDGKTTLEGVANFSNDTATAPDVIVPGNQDGKKNILPEDSTVDDVNVTIEKTAGIVDPNTAGVGKNYSLCIHGFDTEEDAQEFFSDLLDDSDTLTFSDDELEQVAFSATEMVQLSERLNGTLDLDLAFSLKDTAEELHAYSVLADNMGVDCDDVREAAAYYSDEADNVINYIFSEMDVNDFFSELDADEIDAYFSNLDDVEADVLFSIIEDPDERCTFSEAEEIIDSVYSDISAEESLSQPVNELFSEMDEDELDLFFSQLSESELNTIFSVLEEDENATFSDLNEALEPLSIELVDLFSDMTSDEINDFCSAYSDDEVDMLYSMVSDEDENYIFSDFLDFVIENRSFSEDDLYTLANNASELEIAFSDMEEMPEGEQKTELAKQVKVLADATLDDCDKAEACGHDVEDVKNKCSQYAEKSAEVVDNAPADEFDQIDTNHDGVISKEEWKARKGGSSDDEFDRMDTNHDGVVSRDEWKARKALPAPADSKAQEEQRTQSRISQYMGEDRMFSGDNNQQQVNSSINPCLTSVIH